MSASSKKKLRKEQNAAALTEKQQKELKDAKALKRYTLTFVVVMVLVVSIVLGVVISNPINVALDQSTLAITIGGHDLMVSDLNYFYIDAIKSYYNEVYNTYYESYSSYWQLFLGFDTSKPLDEQTYNIKDGTTWAQYFMDQAISNAKSVYALVDKANDAGYKLPDDELEDLNEYFENLDTYAKFYQYNDGLSYIKGNYSNSATIESYKAYYTASTLADSYYADYVSKQEYDDEDLREYEKGKYNVYSTFTFAVYPVSVSKYLGTGTKDEDGNTTYTDEQKAQAQADALKDAQTLLEKAPDTIEKLDEAIKALAINKDSKDAASTQSKHVFYNKISNADIQTWVGNVNRETGDITSITVNQQVTKDDGSTTLEVAGYYIVLFQGREDHKYTPVDVRHILVKFEKADKNDKSTTYTEAEKNTAKAEAEALLKEWEDGKKTEESFAELATKKTDDTGSSGTGGLYENIYKGQMVEPFEEWCYDSSRKPGDTGLVETEYGWHIMYFVETDELTYRDLMIKNDLVNENALKWRNELAEAVAYTEHDLSRMDWDFVLS